VSNSFEDLLLRAGLSAQQVAAAHEFRQCVVEENERQNLTRLLEPEDFFRGHVVDVLELRRFRERLPEGPAPAVDLGTGAGVPGLLSAALYQDESWTLVDSEIRKAEYLKRTVERLGLGGRVKVLHGRVETLKGRLQAPVVVSRAVGSVEKLYSWLEGCSTWNSLILLKGPKWEEEWSGFLVSRWRQRLSPGESLEYSVGGQIKRLIIQLHRVPRGTSKISPDGK